MARERVIMGHVLTNPIGRNSKANSIWLNEAAHSRGENKDHNNKMNYIARSGLCLSLSSDL